MRRYTLIHEAAMDFVLIEDDEAEDFEKFFRVIHPSSGMASYFLGIQDEITRTDEEEARISTLLEEFGVWKRNAKPKGDFCR
jgi:hypothetical protein